MSQEQPQRPQDQPQMEHQMQQGQQQMLEPIKYGDVFQVSGELASQPVAPRDAAALQAAENVAMGQIPKGGPAAAMQSAADVNEQRGVVGHGDVTEAVRDQGATITVADVGGYRVVTESVGGQVVGQYGQPTDVKTHDTKMGAITIGEALEATALSAGDKPVDASDAAAIQAAEARATGRRQVVPGGVAAAAQSAAAYNAGVERDEQKYKLGDVLTDATIVLPDDKPATREDAEGVISAEIRNKPELATHPGGVAASVAAAARLNQDKQ